MFSRWIEKAKLVVQVFGYACLIEAIIAQPSMCEAVITSFRTSESYAMQQVAFQSFNGKLLLFINGVSFADATDELGVLRALETMWMTKEFVHTTSFDPISMHPSADAKWLHWAFRRLLKY